MNLYTFYAIAYAVIFAAVLGIIMLFNGNEPSLSKIGRTMENLQKAKCERLGGVFILSRFDQPTFSVCIEGDKVLNYTAQLPGLWK